VPEVPKIPKSQRLEENLDHPAVGSFMGKVSLKIDFPASWSPEEDLGRSILEIHASSNPNSICFSLREN
jgi:hypothetical protein